MTLSGWANRSLLAVCWEQKRPNKHLLDQAGPAPDLLKGSSRLPEETGEAEELARFQKARRGFQKKQVRPNSTAANKKALQAHVDGAILGQNATQLYTYGVFLWCVPIMTTTSNWDYSSLPEEDPIVKPVR